MKFIVLVCILILSFPSAAQTGPGGVGNSASNFLFLRSDAGTSTITNGSPISLWNDQSGNSNSANQATGGNQPVYRTGWSNGLPSIQFNGTSSFLNVVPSFPLNSDYTKIVVGSTSNFARDNNFFSSNSEHALWLANTQAQGIYHSGNAIRSSVNTTLNQPAITTALFNNSTIIGSIYSDGTLGVSASLTSRITTDNTIQIGSYNNGFFLQGDIGEVIGYNFSLNSAQRIIVENYLAAKFGLSLTANDLYTQDNPGNGNYDSDVAGIGRVNVSNIHNDAQGTGFIRILNPTNLDDGEFFFWGNDSGAAQATNTSDIPSGVTARFARVWRTSETGNVGNVDLQVDLSGLSDFISLSACDRALSIRLLVDTNNNGTFSDQTAIDGATNIGGSIYRFANVSALRNNLRFTFAIVSPSNGPGGVGNSTTNFLFLKSDAGTSTTTNGSALSSWNDQSGNATNAIQPTGGNQPTYKTNQLNGFPSIGFNGTSNFMTCPSVFPTNSDYTKMVVGKVAGTGVANNFFSGAIVHALYLNTGSLSPKLYHSGDFVTSSINLVTNQFALLSGTYINSSRAGELFVNGSSGGTGTASVVNTDAAIQIGSAAGGNLLNGDIAEVIGYNFILNSAQRVIVENYLSAKYNIALTANDVYVQDNAGNGNFDFDVAGIGRVNASNIHSNAKGNGLVRVSSANNLGDGEYFIWGSNNGSLITVNTTDVPAGTQSRMTRVWSVTETGEVGNIDMQFDLSNQGSITSSDLRLLVDHNGNGIFNEAGTIIISGANALSCGNYIFSGVSAINTGMRFTIGSVNVAQTPLPISLTSFEGIMQNGSALLTWSTASELNNNYFVIERSESGEQFSTVDKVTGAGTSNTIRKYQTTDEYAPLGKVYYRLKQVDFDGGYSYSKVIVLENNFTAFKIHVSPNPVTDKGEMLVDIYQSENSTNDEVVFSLYDLFGRSTPLSVNKNSTHSWIVVATGNINPSMYILKVTMESGKSITQRVLFTR